MTCEACAAIGASPEESRLIHQDPESVPVPCDECAADRKDER